MEFVVSGGKVEEPARRLREAGGGRRLQRAQRGDGRVADDAHVVRCALHLGDV